MITDYLVAFAKATCTCTEGTCSVMSKGLLGFKAIWCQGDCTGTCTLKAIKVVNTVDVISSQMPSYPF